MSSITLTELKELAAKIKDPVCIVPATQLKRLLAELEKLTLENTTVRKEIETLKNRVL